MASGRTDSELIELLKKFDTPTISNAVATYPAKTDLCLGLYEPWTSHWYTDATMKVAYPERGRTVGYAVTVVYGLPDPNFTRLSFGDVLRAIDASPKPAILCIKQDFPEEIKRKNGLAGEIMVTAAKRAGAIAMIMDGPSRDVDAIRRMDFQYMTTGFAAGHGPMAVKAVNVPVHLAGMDVAPGEIIHMDENGALKFPAKYLGEVHDRAEETIRREDVKMKGLREAKDIDQLVAIMMGRTDQY